MANTMRWRYGETNPIMLSTLEGAVVEIGDLVFLCDGSARAACGNACQGSLAANQESLHDQFLGVAMQASPAESVEPIRVATTGVFEFDCDLAMFEIGELLGAGKFSSGVGLESQSLVGVDKPNLAIGRCSKQVKQAETKVLVDIVSSVMRGGVEQVL